MRSKRNRDHKLHEMRYLFFFAVPVAGHWIEFSILCTRSSVSCVAPHNEIHAMWNDPARTICRNKVFWLEWNLCFRSIFIHTHDEWFRVILCLCFFRVFSVFVRVTTKPTKNLFYHFITERLSLNGICVFQPKKKSKHIRRHTNAHTIPIPIPNQFIESSVGVVCECLLLGSPCQDDRMSTLKW